LRREMIVWRGMFALARERPKGFPLGEAAPVRTLGLMRGFLAEILDYRSVLRLFQS